MIRHRLTDEQWDLISGALPERKRTGRPPRDYRQVLDGIFWILRTGSAWRDLPVAFVPWSTVWDVVDKWNHDGTLQDILELLRGQVAIDEDFGFVVWIDCVGGSIWVRWRR